MVKVTVDEKNVSRLAVKLVRRKILHRIRNASLFSGAIECSARSILRGGNLLAQHITDEVLREFAGFRVNRLFLRRLVMLVFFKNTVEIFGDGMRRFIEDFGEDDVLESEKVGSGMLRDSDEEFI